MSRLRMLSAAGLVTILLLALLTSQVGAYDTEFNGGSPKWQTGGGLDYQIDPGLSAALSRTETNSNVPDAVALVNDAAGQWNRASQLVLYNAGGYRDDFVRRITSADFSIEGALPSSCNVPDRVNAVVCIEQAATNRDQIVNSATFFNNSDAITWNVNGTMINGDHRTLDFLTVALHEFGHWIFLADINYYPNHHPEAVMWFNGDIAKQALRQDDKHGATMMHGPNTSWENGEAWGYTDDDRDANGVASSRQNVLAYAQNVAGYYNNFNPPPELGRVETELGVSASQYGYGVGQVRMAGFAQDPANSYAYFTTFESGDDYSPIALQNRNYTHIAPGSVLHWCQRNYQQTTMSIDFEMTDADGNVTTLRDSGVVDQYGIGIHPAQRGLALPQGGAGCFDADLDRLAGRMITRWLFAYDNGGNGATGPFRAYFDSVYLFPGNLSATTLSTVGPGTVASSPSGPTYPPNTPVTLTATPAVGALFTGWTINGASAGWANPLTMTVDRRYTVVANFANIPTFSDVSSSAPYYEAVKQMAARGIIKGCDQSASPPLFCPNDSAVRAQSAAFIARAVGWDPENWGNTFPDKCDPNGQFCIDDALWRNVGTLDHYGVTTGYTDPTTCASAGTTTPCYLPRQAVLNVQVISFLARAMIAKGYWARQADNPGLYTNVPASGTQRSDLATYVYYAGPVPGQPMNGPFTGYDQSALRSFFTQAEWQALDSYFHVDRVP